MGWHIHGREDVTLLNILKIASRVVLIFCLASFVAASADENVKSETDLSKIVESEIVDLDMLDIFDNLEKIEQAEHSIEEYSEIAVEIPETKYVPYKPLEFTGADHELVEKWRKTYSTEYSQKWISTVLANGEHYRLYVRQKLAERNMPAILEYLPVVESGYTTNARSKSGALGMWQFMENSIKPFLSKNDFLDERLDPWKATEAALSKLQDNYNTFGDWILAITAYNCGAGAMKRALNKAKEKNFWYLAEHNLLSTETKNYIPKLFALADLIENSEYYGVSFTKIDSETEKDLSEIVNSFDYVTVRNSYSLRRLANEIRMDESTLLSLNPALTRGITPPSFEYDIRLPSGMEQSAIDALAGMEPWGFTIPYEIKKGDTLWDLARKNGTTVAALCDANGISEKAILKIGKIIYLPQK